MCNVILSQIVLDRVNEYAHHYRMYFEETYTDTGIWSEGMIRERYRELALERKQSLRDAIVARLSSDIVFGQSGHNTVVIPWRHKNLHVSWEDIGDMRIVGELEIR